MLAAGGQAKFFRGGGAKLEHPIGEPSSVDEFTRVGDARDSLEVRVARVLLVEAAQGGLEAGTGVFSIQFSVPRIGILRTQCSVFRIGAFGLSLLPKGCFEARVNSEILNTEH